MVDGIGNMYVADSGAHVIRRISPTGDTINIAGDISHPELRASVGGSHGALGWEDLLPKRRVVVLAEAGSGKTEELKEQARLKLAAGQFVFSATVFPFLDLEAKGRHHVDWRDAPFLG